MSLSIFGVRHHGVGCARALFDALEKLRPDLVLVEGPPDAERALAAVADAKMKPPVAMLVYAPDEPSRAAFYPFASFSPEWIALKYAASQNVPIRFIDLPCSIRFALDKAAEEAAKNGTKETNEESEKEPDETEASENATVTKSLAQEIREDPLGALARAADVPDPENWEEREIEQASAPNAIFPELLEIATALRLEAREVEGDEEERLREASMRRGVREALKSGAERIAIVCGAWHAPVLDLETTDEARKSLIPKKKEDDAILSKLPKIQTETTWVAWTYSRLARRSGYGAGVTSPGWLEGLWLASQEAARFGALVGIGAPTSAIEDSEDVATLSSKSTPIARWTTRAARLLRSEGVEVSAANAIEAARLADALASLRGRVAPCLDDARDAILTALCEGVQERLALIARKLEVGNALGSIPDDAPTTPLERDLELTLKRLRLKRSSEDRVLELDLREERDREKSRLFRRLALFGVPWARREENGGLGTFRETWRLRWTPELAVDLIEASRFGATVLEAASNATVAALEKIKTLSETLRLLEEVLPAEIDVDALEQVYRRLQDEVAVSGSPEEIFESIPPLTRMLRYKDVRESDATRVLPIFEALFERALVALPNYCANIDEDAAEDRVRQFNEIVYSLRAPEFMERLKAFFDVFVDLVDAPATSRLISGRFVRLLFEEKIFDERTLDLKISFFTSSSVPSKEIATWLRGFLSGSGQSILWFDSLWIALNRRVASFESEEFKELTPLLRRAFVDFTQSERRQAGETVAKLRLDLPPSTESNQNAQNLEETADVANAAPLSEETSEGARKLNETLRFILGLDNETSNEENAQ